MDRKGAWWGTTAEVNREHGQAAVDTLIRELQLERIFGFRPGTVFDGRLD